MQSLQCFISVITEVKQSTIVIDAPNIASLVSRPSHCPLSPVCKNGGGRYVFLTHLNVYLGKQERGERGKGGGSSPNQNRELAVLIQANIQSCCLLKNTCTKCILSPPPSVYPRQTLKSLLSLLVVAYWWEGLGTRLHKVLVRFQVCRNLPVIYFSISNLVFIYHSIMTSVKFLEQNCGYTIVVQKNAHGQSTLICTFAKEEGGCLFMNRN